MVQKAGATGNTDTGAPANIRLTNGGVLEIGGTFQVTRGSDFTGDATSRLTVPAGGRLEFQGSDEMVIDAPLTLRGELRQNSGTNVKLTKGGTIEGGDFVFQAPGTQFLFTGAAPFVVKTNHCEASGTGLLILDGGSTFQFQDAQSTLSSGSRFLFSGGTGTTATVSGPGVLSAGISFVGRGAVINGTTLRNTGSGTQGGSLTVSGSTVLFQNGAKLENTGTFNFLQAPGSFRGDSTTLFHNKVGGTVSNDSAAAMDIDMPFRNEGTLDLKKAPIRFLKTFTGQGTIRASEGANVTIPAAALGQLPRGLEAFGINSVINFIAPNGDNLLNLSVNSSGRIVAAGGGNIVAAGGGNIVAAGGGNLVAAGGGNLVAAGGGNIVAAGGGNIVAAGGLNVDGGSVSIDGNSLIEIQGLAGIVAAGGGNIVAAGGGNLVAAGGGNLVAAGGGNLVAAGGGNLVAAGGGNLIAQDGGTLVAAGGGNITAQSGGNIIATSGGSLGGSGTYNGAGLVQPAGILSPGQSPGILTWNGTLSIQNGGVLNLEIAGTTPGTQYDVVNVSGALFMDGRVSVSFLSGFQNSISPTDVFTVATSGSAITGTISNLVNGRIIAADGYSSFAVQTANGGKSLVLTDYQTAPLTFANWQGARKFLTPADALPTADPDKDGISNLLEYALGLDPLAANGSMLETAVLEVGGQKYLSASFIRPIGAARPTDVTYEGQRAVLLSSDWSVNDVVVHGIVPATTTERVTLRSTIPISAGVKEFLRLRVGISP